MPDVTGDTQLQSETLEDLSDAHNYRRWLADLARPHLGEHPLEIGSGTGDYAAEWLADVASFTATEADASRLGGLTARFADHPKVRVRGLGLPTEETGDHSAVVALNVLEHIPDDVAAAASMGRLLRPGGRVVLIVPAFPSAMSRFDLAIGHQRRYTLRTMAATLSAAKLTITELRYVNPLGLLSWYVVVRALGMAPRNGPLLKVYDRAVVPVLRRVEGRRCPPFGQSVFAVATT